MERKYYSKLSMLLYAFLGSIVILFSLVDIGHCFQFNGVDDYLIASDSESLDENLLQATIEAWIYLERIPKPINVTWQDIPQKTWAIIFKPDSYELCLFTAAIDKVTYISWHFTPAVVWPFTKFDVKLRRWHHIAIMYDGDSMYCSIDGRIFSRKNAPPVAISNANSELYIGGAPTGKRAYFHGEIKEVCISDIVRYRDDFRPTERFETDEHTRALWRLDNRSGLRDSSGNDNALLYKGKPFSIGYSDKLLKTIAWGQIKKR